MPRRKLDDVEDVTPAAAPSAQEGNDQEEKNPFSEAEKDALSTLFEELAGVSNARVTVYRATRNQPQAYMFSCSPEAFSLDDLRDKYNGGEFRLYITRDGRPWRNLRVNVEPKQRGAEPDAPAPVSELAAVMREGFTQQMELMKQLVAARAPSSFDWRVIAELVPQVIAALRLIVPQPAPSPPPAETHAIDMLMKGFELARELRSEASGDDGLLGVVRDLLKSPLLAQAVAAQQAQPVVPRVVRPAAVTPAVTPPAQPAASVPPVTSPSGLTALKEKQDMTPPDKYAALKLYASFILQKARAEADPALYADLVLDNAPDDLLNEIRSNPKILDEVCANVPDLIPARAWMAELVEIIREALDAPADEVVASEEVSADSQKRVP